MQMIFFLIIQNFKYTRFGPNYFGNIEIVKICKLKTNLGLFVFVIDFSYNFILESFINIFTLHI